MTFVNENRDRIEIFVKTRLNVSGDCQYWIDDVCITPYRKRKSISLAAKIRDRYEYRILSPDERREYIHNEYLKYCTEEQIWEAVQIAYHSIAPTKELIGYKV